MLSPRKKIRLSEVAEAVGTTFKSVRHWFTKYADRGLMPLAKQSDGWLEFAWGDVATVAVAKYLVDIGMPAFEAFDRSKSTLVGMFPDLFEPEPRWVRSEGLSQVILGRDRSGDWLTNDPAVKCPLRVIVNIDQIISEAFSALSDVGHEPPIDNSRATERINRDDLSKRQRAYLVRLRQLKTFEADTQASLKTINDDIRQMQAEADPDEARWMAELGTSK
jgi:hypothetical protein